MPRSLSRTPLILAALLLAALIVLTLYTQWPRPIPHVAAVWHSAADKCQVLTEDEEADPDVALVDVEIWFEGGERKMLRILRPPLPATEPVLIDADLDDDAFAKEIAEQESEHGRCLVGFEASSTMEGPRYVGVLHAGCRSTVFEPMLTPEGFFAALETNAATHHLVDFESVRVDGQLRIAALWHLGGEELASTHALIGVPWKEFHDQAHDLTAKNLRLVDLDIAPTIVGDSEEPIWSAFWRVGEGVDWLAGDYHLEDQFPIADQELSQATSWTGILGQTKPESVERHLAAIEVYMPSDQHTEEVHGGDWSHLGTLHDSGTAGFP